jgi:hypothetical protein
MDGEGAIHVTLPDLQIAIAYEVVWLRSSESERLEKMETART